MSLTMHSASVPVFVKMLNNLLAWMDKAEAHAQARQFDANNYCGLRLAVDMLPFSKQIQIASDGVKGCLARLAGVEIPKWDDDEASFDDLRQRVRKTLAYAQGFAADQIAGSEGREIVLPRRVGEPLKMDGETFLKHYVLPNFYFHVTTAYALLRHAGVELGKKDYLGSF